jgi:hypothetical protein
MALSLAVLLRCQRADRGTQKAEKWKRERKDEMPAWEEVYPLRRERKAKLPHLAIVVAAGRRPVYINPPRHHYVLRYHIMIPKGA